MKKKNLLLFLLPAIMLLFSAAAHAQAKKISGKVVNDAGLPLAGVSVLVKGSTGGTMSANDGSFSISVNSNAVLVFSYVGYEKQEVTVKNKTEITITLVPEKNELAQVVVIGYGNVKKSDLTGSVVSVRSEDLKKIPATSFDQALQGRAAGVQVTSLTGKPGGETSIRIRGTTSINAGNEPLYVIDGMLVSSDGGDMNTGVTLGPRISPLSSINPNDIESIEILKDASATAIYGSRGANGVIIITTKRGKGGKGSFNYETYYGLQQVAKKIDVMNASEFADFVNDAKINAGQTPVYVMPGNNGVGTNWQDEVLRVAPIWNNQLSFSGASKKLRYSLTGSYFAQDGIIIQSDFKRYSFRGNIDWNITKKLTAGVSYTYANIKSTGVLTNAGTIIPGVITNALLFNPNQPVYDSTVPGGYTYENDRGKTLGNPVAEAEKHLSLSKSSRHLGNVYVKYELLKGLELKSSFGIDAYDQQDNSYAPYYLKRAEASHGEASEGTNKGSTWLNENTITYTKDFKNNHRINAVAGFTAQQFHNDLSVAYAFDFPDDNSGYHSIDEGKNPQIPYYAASKWTLLSYLGRINYTINDKYLFTATGRVDGSSKFAEGNKYGFFPSGAFAWRVSKEKFMEKMKFMNDLKLRASYGLIGNQAIAPYQSLSLVGPFGEGVFNSSAGEEVFHGMESLTYANKKLKWESTRQLDIGVDISMFKSRITITADYYQKKTFDLLLSTPIPSTTGFLTTVLNIGNIVNKGFDLDIKTINTTGAVKWNSSFNFSRNKNTITNLNSDVDIPIFGGLILRQGESIGTFYGYIFDGIFQTDAEAASSAVLPGQEPTGPNPASHAKAGDRKYKDLDGDGKITPADRTLLGTAQPNFTYGFSNTISYKNFDLSIFFNGSQGNKLANYNSFDLLNLTGQGNVLRDAGLNRWTPENPGNKYPRALASGSLDVGIFSSAIVEDASYIRLRNVTLAYRIPMNSVKKQFVKNIRTYIGATNIFTITDYTGFDPEANTFGQSTTLIGIDQGGYPSARTITLGISVGF